MTTGATTLELANPTDTSNFKPPEWIAVDNGNHTTYPRRDYLDVNEVMSTEPTGKLYLLYPMSKPYSATLPLPTPSVPDATGIQWFIR